MKYKIYQIKDVANTNYAFVGWNKAIADMFTLNDYSLVYEGEIEKRNCLDKLFEIFNINRPADFHGHSLSVSDVVALKDDGKDYWYWYYCDSFGWEEITEKVNVMNEEKEDATMNNRLTINLDMFNECQIEWLTQMFENEIEETEGDLANERLWLNGTVNEEESYSHQENISMKEEYKKELEYIVRKLRGE